MKTTLRKIGNSRGIIIPKGLIEKYDLHKVEIVETEKGILLISDNRASSIHDRLNELKSHQEKWLKKVEAAASQKTIQDYYQKEAEEFGDIDIDIIE